MRKLFLLSVVAGLFFAACGTKAPEANADSTAAVVDSTVQVADSAAPVADSAK